MLHNKRRILGLWQFVLHSLQNSQWIGTGGDLHLAALALSIPMILEMVFDSLFGLVDMFWVARLNHAAIATVGITEPVMSLVLSTGMGIGLGATAIVARRAGENEWDEVGRTAFQAVLL